MLYQIIYADPPWDYNNWSPIEDEKIARKVGRTNYPTMNLEDICRLPVSTIADKDCILFLWATPPCIEQAFEVIKSWGFFYKTFGFSWVKQNKQGWGYYSGLGNWTLGNLEVCLLATHKTFPKRKNPVKQLMLSPLRGHSQKPDETRERIIQLMGDLPRIELFSRQKVEGWDSIGFDIDGYDIRESLDKLVTL